MKFSIGFRLFFAVLLSILGVAAMGLALMAGKVNESFSDYAIQIELNRLQEVSESLQSRYAEQNSWSFIPADSQEKLAWVNAELLRLYQKKSGPTARTKDDKLFAPDENAALVPTPHPPPQIKMIRQGDMTLDAMLPPLPAVPPVPPEPPAPPVLLAAPVIPKLPVHAASSMPVKSVPTIAATANKNFPSLYTRITLLDGEQHYLAGRPLDLSSSASRSIYMGDKVIGYLRVTKSDQPTDAMAQDFLQKQTDTILIIIALSVLLSAAAASLLAMHFRRPISRLVEGSRLLANVAGSTSEGSRFISRRRRGGWSVATSSRAKLMAPGTMSVPSMTRSRMPSSCAWRAPSDSPPSIISRERAAPTSRGKRWVPPDPGINASLISGKPTIESDVAHR